MTLRTLIACASPLSGSHTVREHLSAIDCADLGTGGDCISFSARGSFAVKRKTIDFGTGTSLVGFKPLFRTVGFDNDTGAVGFKTSGRVHKFKIGDCNG